MMERKYQLVAWTENVVENDKVKLRMIPSLEYEVQEPYIAEIDRCQEEVKKAGGHISTPLARRFIRAYERNAEFSILTGHYGDGIRYICKAALYCIWEDDFNWTYWDTDLGSYSCFCGELRHEFRILCEKAVRLAGKYGLEHILQEKEPKDVMELYYEHTQESRDMAVHMKNVSAWM